MTEFINLWNNYWTLDRIAMAMWIFNAAIQAMEKPNESNSKFYSFLFRFFHIIGGNTNVSRKESARINDVSNIRLYNEVAEMRKLRRRGKSDLYEESPVPKMRPQ